MNNIKGRRIVYALTGSFCTFEKAIAAMEKLVAAGAEVTPAMSYHAATVDTRFGKAAEFKRRLEQSTGHKVLLDLVSTEPIGPAALADIVVVAPGTGNTMGKLAWGIVDTPVLMACKSQLRNGRPVLLALSTNDALSAGGQNLGRLLNAKNIYFVPMYQDAWQQKPASLTADYDQLEAAIGAALEGRQMQPVIFQ